MRQMSKERIRDLKLMQKFSNVHRNQSARVLCHHQLLMPPINALFRKNLLSSLLLHNKMIQIHVNQKSMRAPENKYYNDISLVENQH